MTKRQHTPGPWFLDENRRGSHISVHSREHGDLARVVWQMASDYQEGKASPTCEANAHLIAAAPDLLEALVRMERHDFEVTGEDVAFALAALAKARGEA